VVFLFEERRAFVRTISHTVVRDTDPDFAELSASGTGLTPSLVRVWLADVAEGALEAVPRAYLGSVTFCPSTPLRAQLATMLRRLNAAATGADEHALRTLRRRLTGLLRRFRAPASSAGRKPRSRT
jgi:hypothetical protein